MPFRNIRRASSPTAGEGSMIRWNDPKIGNITSSVFSRDGILFVETTFGRFVPLEEIEGKYIIIKSIVRHE